MPDRENLSRAIEALEAQRATLGDDVVEAALVPLREALAAAQAEVLGEQRKLVTILFADLAGFTSMASDLDPEDVRELMNAYFQSWSAVIRRHGGVVEKFIGDAVLAVFGLPVAHENDPERAVLAALEMQKELNLLNDRLQPDLGTRLAMRVGINTGEVVVSLLGERGGEEFVVVGDPVNLASRVQAAAPSDGILMTSATARHVQSRFEAEPYGPLDLKGVSQPVSAFLIKAARPTSFRTPAEKASPRLIGRGAELSQLRDTFRDVRSQRRGQAVTIVGDAGVGKSRLLLEFDGWLHQFGVPVHGARAHPSWLRVPFSLIRNVFAERAAIQDSDPPPVVRKKLEAIFASVFDANPDLKAHFVARLVGLEIGESHFLIGYERDPKAFHDSALGHLEGYFEAAASAEPVVLLCEDLHWADDASLDVIRHLVTSLADAPFLVVAGSRPSLFERRPDWDRELSASRINLAPLPPHAAQALLDELLGSHHAPTELRKLISAADGNPFYIEELLKMLIEDGLIALTGTRWQFTEPRLDTLKVPPTLTGILQARFDSLDPRARVCLQQGSVFGRVFWDKAVETLAVNRQSAHKAEVQEVLADAATRELILRQDRSTFESTEEYVFKHALLRDVTYSTLLKRDRRHYHEAAARWLAEMSGRVQREGEFAMLIGDHYEQAQQATMAASWYLRAGIAAAAQFANQDALRALGMALDLNPEADSGWRARVLLQREAVLDLLGERARQLQDLDDLQTAAAESADVSLAADVALRQARFAHASGAFPAALDHARQAEALAIRAQHKGLAARGALAQAGTLMRLGDLTEADRLAARALSLTEDDKGLIGLRAEAIRHQGLIAYYNGRFDLALEYFGQALELYREAGDLQGQGMAINNLGGTTFELGNYQAAGDYYNKSLELCRSIGDRLGQARALNNLGIIAVTQRQYAVAENRYRESLRISRETGNRSYEMSALDNLGNLSLYRYQYAHAESYHLACLSGAREMGDRITEVKTLTNLARAYLCVGEVQRAREHSQANLALAEALHDTTGICSALVNLSRCAALDDDLDDALARAEQAVTIAVDNGLRSELAWARQRTGQVLARLGRFDEAVGHFRNAYELRMEYEEIGEALSSAASLAVALTEKSGEDEALRLIEKVMAHLVEHGREGLEEPEQIFLNSYRVLQAVNDDRADSVLEQGCRLIEDVASGIESDDLRNSYLTRLPATSAILELCQ